MLRKSLPSGLTRGWVPVFPRDKREAFVRRSCSNKRIERDDDSKKSHPALARFGQATIGSGEALTISRWMPPQRVHRMVQYSQPARPPITRSTTRLALQSGQFDRADE